MIAACFIYNRREFLFSLQWMHTQFSNCSLRFSGSFDKQGNFPHQFIFTVLALISSQRLNNNLSWNCFFPSSLVSLLLTFSFPLSLSISFYRCHFLFSFKLISIRFVSTKQNDYQLHFKIYSIEVCFLFCLFKHIGKLPITAIQMMLISIQWW